MFICGDGWVWGGTVSDRCIFTCEVGERWIICGEGR